MWNEREIWWEEYSGFLHVKLHSAPSPHLLYISSRSIPSLPQKRQDTICSSSRFMVSRSTTAHVPSANKRLSHSVSELEDDSSLLESVPNEAVKLSLSGACKPIPLSFRLLALTSLEVEGYSLGSLTILSGCSNHDPLSLAARFYFFFSSKEISPFAFFGPSFCEAFTH